MIAFRASRVRQEPLLQMIDVTAMAASGTPSENSFHNEMANDAFGRVRRLAMLAEPAFLEVPPALAARRLDDGRLLVHLTHGRNPTEVDDFSHLVPHLVPMQQVDVRLQPIFLHKFIDRQIVAPVGEADKNRGRRLNVANFRLERQAVGQDLKRLPELNFNRFGHGQDAGRIGRL